jgi:hypothetical protein
MLFGIPANDRRPSVRRISRTASAAVAATIAVLLVAAPAFPAPPDIPILVDGVPLDARGVAIRGEVYIPAWILENFGGTKVEWVRPANLLQVDTASRPRDPVPAEGTLTVKVGAFPSVEGFAMERTTRLYLLNTDPREFRFPDGKSAADRAHEGAVGRIDAASPPAVEYLRLSPTARSSREGWAIVSRMPKEEIFVLPAIVERYEALYSGLYYDLLTTLVLEMELRVRESGALDPALRNIRIVPVSLDEEGGGSVRSSPGIRFLFGRTLYGARQAVWNVPVVIQGGAATAVELSLRNAAFHQ